MIIIDANNAIAGRVGTYAAKQALLGEKVAIVNADKAVITGAKKSILADWKQRLERGTPVRGPFYSRWPDRLLRRIIRGMLPYKQTKGAEAFARIMCYQGIPTEFKEKEAVKVPGSDVSKTKSLKYLSLGELSRHLMSQ